MLWLLGCACVCCAELIQCCVGCADVVRILVDGLIVGWRTFEEELWESESIRRSWEDSPLGWVVGGAYRWTPSVSVWELHHDRRFVGSLLIGKRMKEVKMFDQNKFNIINLLPYSWITRTWLVVPYTSTTACSAPSLYGMSLAHGPWSWPLIMKCISALFGSSAVGTNSTPIREPIVETHNNIISSFIIHVLISKVFVLLYSFNNITEIVFCLGCLNILQCS